MYSHQRDFIAFLHRKIPKDLVSLIVQFVDVRENRTRQNFRNTLQELSLFQMEKTPVRVFSKYYLARQCMEQKRRMQKMLFESFPSWNWSDWRYFYFNRRSAQIKRD